MKDGGPLRILVITTHRVADTVGGELLLHRHIRSSPRDWQFHLHHLDDNGPIRRRRWIARVRHRSRRMQRLFNAWDAWSGVSVDPSGPGRLCRDIRPDLLYTVADGPVAMRVCQLSRRTGIPFVAQLNDWAPGGLDIPQRLAGAILGRFRGMLRRSAVALCFSEEIRAAAGSPPGSRVLYPVPEKPPPLPPPTVGVHALFAGRFDHFLGAEMHSLVRAAIDRGETHLLRSIGPDVHWDDGTRRLFADAGIHGGLLKGPGFHAALQSALVLLVLAPFGRDREHIAHYSFPGKIPEYCHHGRPILVWGPGYSSSASWARRTGAALAVTEPDPVLVLDAIGRIGRDSGLAEGLVRAARIQASTAFDPAVLQGIFEQAVADAARSR